MTGEDEAASAVSSVGELDSDGRFVSGRGFSPRFTEAQVCHCGDSSQA